MGKPVSIKGVSNCNNSYFTRDMMGILPEENLRKEKFLWLFGKRGR